MSAIDEQREESFNVMLSELLAEKGLKALGEVILRRKGKRHEPDVLIELNGVRIVIEGKKVGAWNILLKNCENRLDNNVCDLCMMVEYVDLPSGKLIPSQTDVKESLLTGRFNIGFISFIDRAGLDKWTNRRSVPDVYEEVGFEEILTYLMAAYSRVVTEDIIKPVVQKMEGTLDEFAHALLSTTNVDRLNEVLELRKKEAEDSD